MAKTTKAQGADTTAAVSARETEIARRFLQVLERLPLRAMHNLLRNLRDGVQQALEQSAGDPATRWTSYALPSATLELLRDAEARVEVPPNKHGTLERLDLVLPVAPTVFATRLVTSIAFEFKLAQYDLGQLKRYAGALSNSLLISVSKESLGIGTLVRQESGTPIAFQTWEHLYFGLQNMLSGDAAPRTEQIEEPDDQLLKFDHRLAGQDRASFEIEGFLELLMDRDLLPNRDLVLVVPRGVWATDTLKTDPPYYRHPDSWRSGYRYLVTVYRNKIEEIFEVLHSVSTDPVDGTPPPPPEGVDPSKWISEIAPAGGSRVSVLRRLDASHEALGRYLQWKYLKLGPQGHPAAFTQTHRYVESPDDLGRLFTVPPGQE